MILTRVNDIEKALSSGCTIHCFNEGKEKIFSIEKTLEELSKSDKIWVNDDDFNKHCVWHENIDEPIEFADLIVVGYTLEGFRFYSSAVKIDGKIRLPTKHIISKDKIYRWAYFDDLYKEDVNG